MSLLTRMAIGNGSTARKAKAIEILAAKDRHKLAKWHQSLLTEIDSKLAKIAHLKPDYKQNELLELKM